MGICLSARAVGLDKETHQLHSVSMDIYISGANVFRLAFKTEKYVSNLTEWGF